MRKAVLVVIVSLTTGAALADGYWDGRDLAPMVPLESFLDATVPVDDCWKVRIAESLRGKPVVAAPASLGWQDRLRAAAAFNKFEVAVDERACVVAINAPKAAPAATQPVPPAPIAGSTRETAAFDPERSPDAPTVSAAAQAQAHSAAAPVVPAAVAVIPEAASGSFSSGPVFGLSKGTNLRAQIERWAQMDGWDVAWELSYDYPVTAEAAFGTDLFEAVENLVRSYERIGQMRDVEWVFNGGNRVLVVRPVDRFMQAGRQSRAPRSN